MTASLESYAAYKPSGVARPQAIPVGWEVRRLKYVTRLAYGDALAADSRETGAVPVFGSNGQVGTHGTPNTSAPAVIVGRKGSFGKVLFSPTPAFAIDTTYYCDQSTTREDVRWLARVLSWLRLDDVSKDSAVPGLDRDDAYAMAVPVPPSAEQAAIVRHLDHVDSRIQRLIMAKERLVELLEEEKQAIIHRAVTRGLDPNARLKPSGVDWLGDVPEHWKVRRLHELTDPGRRIMYGIVLPGPHVDDGVFIVKGGNCEAGRLRADLLSKTTAEIESQYARSRLVGGDIVIAIRGGVGAAELVPHELAGANLTQDAARIAAGHGVSTPWLLQAVRSHATQQEVISRTRGATVRGINIRDLKRIPLPVPPREEQVRIADAIHGATRRVSMASSRAQREISLLREYRTRLISDVVTGKLDVREAASKLPRDSDVDDTALEERLVGVVA